MNLTQLLENLSAKNVELWVEGDKLRYRGSENVLTPELLTQIKQHKLEIIRILSVGSYCEATYALSHGQKALWFLYQLAPSRSAYNISYAARLVTNLDIPALEQAAQALVERHPVLRTTFTTIDGEPVQRVHNNQQVDFSVEDAFALTQDDINNWLLQTSARPFDLEVGPIVRFNLLINQTATTEYILLITQHHIGGDFRSGEIILEELEVLYSAIKKDLEPLLPVQKSKYQDYVSWSEEMLTGAMGESLWNYWQQQLCGELPVLNLPTHRPRPQIQTYNGESLFFRVSEKLLQKLTELALKERASLYMILLTAFQILLLRYTNQEDILIGSPMINRSLQEFEKIIGYFTNPVVLRADLSGNPTFCEMLGRSRECVLDALEHQEYPFPLLVERLQPVRDPSISPIYQVAFAWDRAHHSDKEVSLMDSDGLLVESLTVEALGAPFDLTLNILQVPGSLKGTWNYNTDLFDSSTIERMTGHFMTMLEAIVANPLQKISQLPLLTEFEQQQLLVEWNRTQVDYPQDKCIHQLFEEQVARTPDAVAVVFENQQLTYGELNTRANQLAHYLRSLGVGADVLVGLCVERSVSMIVGLLGILKAGGAYVPLDPEYPAERLRFMLEDAKISVLLTQHSLQERLSEHQAQLVCLDTDWNLISQSNQDNLNTVVQATHLAYVMYTSGSTGQPKGVEVIHRGVSRLLFGVNYVHLDATQRFLQLAPISFDASTLEIWGALLHGGLCVIFNESIPTAKNLGDEIDKHGISVLWLTAALFNSIIDENSVALSGIRQLLIGGEALSVAHVQKAKERLPETQIINGYGPTESTTFTCCHPIARQLETTKESIPIGGPIANTLVYILDSDLQPVPVGVPGELHIGGAGLARGYLNARELTAEKFIPNPFNKSKVTSHSSKLYKTGDLARYLPDGNIEYLGRIDNQVKIRGFRIELGEIEAVLSQHELVQVSVVIAREDTPGNKRLVAYIVSHPEVKTTVSELLRFLKEKLPEYMVPNAFVFLESLPLNPNGKVDRRALPVPEIRSEDQNKYVAPRTPTEEMLAQIWAQVLKVERVGRHDNFFTLGGHSLLATQLVSRIRTLFKVELPLRSLFATATVAELAVSIQQLQLENQELTSPPVLPRAENAELPLSFAQSRLWFLEQLEPLSAAYNIPMALRLIGNLHRGALEQSLIEIIDRHEALRTNFIAVNGKAAQIIHTAKDWKVSIVELQHLPITEQQIASKQLAQQIAIEPFDLSGSALVRATLVVLSEAEHVLLVCMHHIVSDGWSMGVLVSELAALYNAYSQGLTSPLEPLPIQYADFALWQRQWLQAEVLNSQLSYWLQQLAGVPTFLPLATDRPRGAVQSFCGAYHEFALTVELTQGLTKLSQEQGCTLFMTLLAAFKTLLYRYSGQTDIVVGSPIANRNQSEIEGLIGFFVNTLVMRTDLEGNPSFHELLPRVRSMALSAYAHQDLPFEMLVEALQPERDLSYTPLFQVMFALQNAPRSEVELNELKVSLLPIETATAKFDLTLTMENTATGLVGEWEYNTDLFDGSTIERMTGHLITMLSAIVANPQERISQLPLLTPGEQQQLLVEWNQTQVNYPKDRCIHQLFEQQCFPTPDAVAVVFEDQQLTYAQLNSRANQLAHYLRSLGVGANVLVGICVERSPEMIVGILGILKAGGAYLPLDPEYPTERLKFMLEDAQAGVLLTQQHLVKKLQSNQAQVVCLDTQWQLISQFSQENLNTVVQATDLAYVIYTSGSTGTPKGVLIATEGLLNLVKWHQQTFQITSTDKATQLAGTGFDAAVWEIWPYLTIGATIYLVRSELLTEPVNLRDWLVSRNITVSFVPTPVTQELLSLEWTNTSIALRYILTGGDKLTSYPSASVPFQVVNNYGPTENTVVATSGLVVAQMQQQISPSIGRPISNTFVYILDSDLQPVPVGVPGELHIAGVGLARGYLNRPDLTQEKFILNPFDNSKFTQKNSLLYKTGDLARYLPSGNIEYLGRIDNQVKIRGLRIELGEIDATLSQHKDVQSSVVIAREDIPGIKRLVAYIVPPPQVTPTISELRQFLKTKLPDYMVPTGFVVLESLPLTPNGKIDKSALPLPESRTGIEVPVVAPRTPIEAKLALIWAQVLGVEVVGIDDNFFELGGDSILSIQIIARAKLEGIELTLKQLFANQTIAQLATVALTTKVLSIEQGLVSGTLPLTPIQQWFFEQNIPKHHFNQSILLTVPSQIKQELLEQVFWELLLHHDALRLRFTQTDGCWQPTHATPSSGIAIKCFDLSTLTHSQQQTTLEITANELQASLNLSENLVQVALFRLGSDNEARLLIIIHHLVVDGVSWRILLEDLQKAYQQLSESKAIQLPAKTTSFKDWSQQLTNYAQSHLLKSELAYWLSASTSTVSPLPVDYAQGVNTVASTCTVSVSLNTAQTHSLLQDVPKAYKTQINDVLLTALVLVVSSWTNSKSVLFNLEGHGREDIIDGVDLSRTVGWFTTMFPVVLKLLATDNDNLGSALKSVKEQLRAIPNKGIGYGLLRYLNSDALRAQLQTIPQPQISFNYLGQFTQVLNTSSLISPASEKGGQSQSLVGHRPNLLDINAIIANEQLQIDWTYSSNIHHHSTIENLAQEFEKTLLQLIAHCLKPENVGYTPTDFPWSKLNQQELDGVLARLALTPKLGKTHWQNIQDIYALSPMQEGMLFETLYAPDKSVYFEQITCTFSGLNVQAFEQAWQQVVVRHSVLRTALEWESISQPLQVVYRQVNIRVETLDWQGLSKLEQQAQLESFLSLERQQGFQLSIAPLMRLYLLQLDENTYQFVWCHHHILLDGWSLPLVFKDLLEFYQAICEGVSRALEPTISYRNYIAWLQQQDLDLAKQFWRAKLQGFRAPTPLTVDQPLSNRVQHSSYSEQEIHVTVPQTAAVVSFVQQHQLTMNNLVQVTWALLLSRYSGENDLVFGATVSGRPPTLIGVESMVGLFINTVPVRVQISPETELLALLKDLQAQQVESEQFSYCSLVEIQGVSDVPRGTSLFESIVVFENYPVDSAVLEDHNSFTLDNFRGIEHTNYPLTVVAVPGEQLLLKVSYDAGRFEHHTIGRMLGHFLTMLSAIVVNPLQKISQLPLLTASEQQQLLVEWNNTRLDYACDKCIHQLFEEQVARTPDAVAVVFEDQQLTYTELNTRANQLAHYLRSLGVGPDVLVGLCVERSLSMVVGLLGILKAGGAYVPLDPEYPTERLSFMLEDSLARVLLTQQHLVESLPQHQARVVHLDSDWRFICESRQENPITEVQASNLAYVIYTSGSTGQPKGVMLSHRNLCNHMFWMQATFPLTEKDKVLQKTPFSFDASVWEFYATLLVGGQLLIAPPGGHTDSAYLLRLIAQHQVTTVQLVPSLLQMLLEQGGIETCHSLKQVFCGGEVLPMTLLEGLLSKLNLNLYNLYGPTEACIDATSWDCLQQMNGQLVPIGRPISNTQVYILDQDLQPVPVGVPGELHIGGMGLARGYLNRPDLTAEKFIPNPFDNSNVSREGVTRHSSKLYKTGDKARYLPDGSIEYLGRIDNQVKIRGFRIELGEIEAVLNLHENVQACCVIARVDPTGDQRLVAYIVPQPEPTPTVSELRQFLKEKLPNYMVPSAIVMLESLPLMPNGKIDKSALPVPESPTIEVPVVTPRTPIEAKLAQIWAQVLKVELVGIDDNFFEIGGHSLLATQVMSRFQEAFGTSLPLRSLFESPTIAQLSEVVLAQLQTGSGLTVPAIVPVSSRQDIPLSWAQERLWFVHQIEGESGAYTMSFTVGLVGDLNIKALEQAFQSMVQRHEVLRTRFEIKNDLPVQVIVPNITITLPVVDLQQVPDPWKQLKELATKEVAKPFDLAHGSVLRVMLWQISPQEYVLLVAIHHIAADGWSTGIFIQELSAYYRAITTGSSVKLPELAVQYADFAVWQRQWLTDQILERQLNYWMQQLAGTPPLLELPTDRSRPAIQTFRGSIQRLQLDGLLTQQLKKLSQESGTTLFMTLLAGFVVLMSRYSGQRDLVVGSPIANRNRTEIEPLIGFFVNTLALRFHLSPEQSFEALLAQVQQVTQNAYDHQDLPFEMLVEHLQLERNLDRNPLVQVMFALQNAPTSPWDLPGLRVEEMLLGFDSVRFDLEVHLWDLPEGLAGGFCYNQDLFDEATIVRMMQHFQTLLAAIVADPQQPVVLLPLLTQHEGHQILVEWNNTQADYPQNQCIHQLFEEQVERTPNAVAVVYGNQQLTYHQLNCRANKLAHYLRSLGVVADVLVGLCVERSVSMVVGLLGILKAGGAYVPLDPEYPTERLTLILEDAQVKVLLTTDKLADTIPEQQASVICYNHDSAQIALQSEENPTAEVTSDHLAYVIYTSGSTGKPKGVSVAHRGVIRLVMNTNYINIEPLDVIAQASNYAFDAATFEIWGALLRGAQLLGVSKQLALSPKDFAALIREQGISVLFLTTALFNQIAQAVPYAFNSLRYLLFGGEAVDPKWVQQVLKNGGPQRLLHVYGPTENTTFTSWYWVQDVPKDATTIPIGRPIANTQVYILDSDLQPVPVGVPGELHIGGAGLARGYLNARELTQQKFIPNPFNHSNTQQNSKLYKTGDLARYLPDGNIEYLSRIDNQVKIRGFRIELGEIEAVLNQHPLVQESVVVTRTNTSGDQSLVAYLVPGSKSQVLPEQFAQWQSEYVSDWQTLYEQAYGPRSPSTDDLTLNLAGWNSSYTRQPIPESEMREWVESTVSRILALLPQRALEIGCGTGLLLSRIAKGCPQYWGTDYSIAAIKHVEQVCATVEGLEHVRLLHQMADNFTGIPQGEFDIVILNSIVQYFPSVEYLLQVLEGAIATIDQKGKIFVGDVRSLPLLEPYCAAVQLSQAAESKTIEQWQQQVHQSAAAEEELVIDPRFFIALKQRFPQMTWVEIQPKRGNSQNELTQFRYDVTIHLGTAVQTTVVPWLNWQLDQLSFTQIHNQLLSEQPELLGIRGVPNQRVQQALQIWQWLEHPPSVETVGQLRELLAQQPTAGINPEQLWQLGQDLGYTVDVSWWGSSHDGSYDVVFCRNSTLISDPRCAIAFWDSSTVTAKPWTEYTNNPLHGKLVQKLVPQVREFIQQKLPNYMVPQTFVLLNALPLTPNGKVDRRALPTPDTASRNLSTGFVSPRTPMEAKLTQIWSEVLGLELIGVKDNFFELGGHSLLATQVISRINSAFALDLSVQKMFEFPTIAGIAAYMEVMDWATTDLPVDNINAEIVEF